uniref:Uncharacterized protein n=1 Tax=Pristionchus pacificus TaxID=54126 RepID=A0A2A6CUZ5_PRIPA|eukprot:PDM81920.1 hypothetical protein PRIPAC_34074 [Pristionchus pacificus]
MKSYPVNWKKRRVNSYQSSHEYSRETTRPYSQVGYYESYAILITWVLNWPTPAGSRYLRMTDAAKHNSGNFLAKFL